MKSLFETVRIGNLELKNRFVRSALWMRMADEAGFVTEELIKTYGELAEGGVGLLVTGYAYVRADDQPNPRMMGASSDDFLPGLTRLAQAVHAKGGLVALQLAAGGSQTNHPEASSMRIVGPSAIQNRVTGLTPRELTLAELQELSQSFAEAALRGVKAGFDAVEIHAAHGYLLSQFLSPYYNRRTDQYGGSIHNRARLIYEVLGAIRGMVGKDFPVLIKLNHDDFMDDGEGLTLGEAKEVAIRLDELGIDAIEVSAANESSGKKGLGPARTRIPKAEQQSYFFEATRELADLVKAPVILMGGNRSPELLTSKLNESRIALVALARPLLSEPDLVNRWLRDPGYKPKCVSCNGCYVGITTTCVLNRASATGSCN